MSFKNASLCLTNSNFTLNKMDERIPEFNGKACPLGLSSLFPLNKMIPKSDHHSGEAIQLTAVDEQQHKLGDRVLLLVGRMDPAERKKGHYPLLTILPDLHQIYPDIQLVFPGPGEDNPNLEKLTVNLGVSSSVFFPGLVSVEMLARLYECCYAYVMPSKQEGFGLTYLEAMNYGKPCIGCFDDGAEDVIVHGETGFLVQNPDDGNELMRTLRMLLDDPAKATKMGEKGFERLHQHFTAQHVQDRIKRHIAGVLT